VIPLARLVRLAAREIATNRLRSALLVVSVAAAVAAMTVVTQLGVTAEKAVADDVLRSQGLAGTYAVTISSPSALPGVLAAATSEGIDGATGRAVELSGGTVSDPESDRAPVGLAVHAVDPGVVGSMPTELLAGRWLEHDDATLGVVPIVLDSSTAATLWPEAGAAEVIGRTLRLTYPYPTYTTVVGVVGDGPLVRFTDGGGFVPLADEGLPGPLVAWASHLEAPGADVRLYLTTGDRGASPADEALGTVRARVAAAGAVTARSSVQRLDSSDDFDGSATVLSIVMRSVGIIVLAVGVLAVATVSTASLRERAGELALRRAMGASPRSLGALVLAENVMIVGAGALLGVVLILTSSHVLATWVVVDRQTRAMAQVDVSTALTALAATGLLGVLVSLLPARRAARQGVMDVLAS
jgi:putative ABC transport system permease protein